MMPQVNLPLMQLVVYRTLWLVWGNHHHGRLQPGFALLGKRVGSAID